MVSTNAMRERRIERIMQWGSSMKAMKKRGVAAWLLRELGLALIRKKADDLREMAMLSRMFDHDIDWDASPVSDDTQQ
jgi:hypothetical protein